jgi:hypothetical protein
MNPLGTVIAFYGLEIENPDGEEWTVCNGDPISRQTYGDLYGLVGDTFGSGDGVYTFNVPKLQNLFIRGLDMSNAGYSGRDRDAGSRGAMGTGGPTGNKMGTVEADAVGPHTHQLAGIDYVSGSWLWGNCDLFQPDNSDGTPWGTTDPTGSGETRPKNVHVNWIIRIA